MDRILGGLISGTMKMLKIKMPEGEEISYADFD
jgi:hypothetical protein